MIPGLNEFLDDLAGAARSGRLMDDLMEEAGVKVSRKSAELLISEAQTFGKSSEAKYLAITVESLRNRIDKMNKEAEEEKRRIDEYINGLREQLSEERNIRHTQRSEFSRTLDATCGKLSSIGEKMKKSEILKAVHEAREIIKKHRNGGSGN